MSEILQVSSIAPNKIIYLEGTLSQSKWQVSSLPLKVMAMYVLRSLMCLVGTHLISIIYSVFSHPTIIPSS